jgi:diguanylate cyclase (GGDEF)-like protein/PAS domain S-box-containing protein
MEIGRDARSVKSLSRHILEQMVTLSSDGILLADAQDPNLPIVYANPAYEGLSGYSAAELKGTGWQLPKRDCDGQPELERLKAAIGRSEPCQATIPDLRKDGSSWFSHVSVEPLYNARGDLKYFLCIQKPAAAVDGEQASAEVTLLQRELGRARQKIANLDRTDPITGLLRIEHFQEMLRRDLAVARRERRGICVAMFGIVELEAYRATFGAKAAESCQRMIGAQISRKLRRASDLCARYDDNTLVAATFGQEPHEVQRLADQIAENVRGLALHNPRARTSRYIALRTLVIGCPPGSEDDADELLARAHAQLHGAPAP